MKAGLLGLAVVLALPVRAEPLTEAQAVERALSSSPALAALEARVGEARAQVDAASRLDNPELRVSKLRSDRLLPASLGGQDGVEAPFEDLTLGLRWSPPNLGSQYARKAQAERRVELAQAELAEARADLAARVRTLHATVLGLTEQAAQARTALALRAELKALVARRLEQQVATLLDRSLADLDHLDALTAVQEADGRRRQALHGLRVELGLAPGEVLELRPDGAARCELPPEPAEALGERARAGSARLKGFVARKEEVAAERSRLNLELIPWFSHFEFAYVLGPADGPGHVRARFGLSLPLFHWNRPEIRGLDFRRTQIDAEERAALELLDAQVRQTLEDLADLVALVGRYREAGPVMDDGLAVLRKALEAGQSDLVQLALLQTRTLAARRGQLRAQLQCQLVRIELDRLVGPAAEPRR